MFEALDKELKKWAVNNAQVKLWWRDDDVVEPTTQLEQLLAISERYQTPLGLAAIPAGVKSELTETIRQQTQLSILQHGYSHTNHAPPEQRKMELGAHRPLEVITNQLKAGRVVLNDLFAQQFNPVLVPPWNRIAQSVIDQLTGLGFVGLSDLGPRNPAQSSDSISRVNVHVDIIDWHNGRCFAGQQLVVGKIVTHLSAKRKQQADPAEPTGIMTHHLVHDQACWTFLDQLFEYLSRQEIVQVRDSRDIF